MRMYLCKMKEQRAKMISRHWKGTARPGQEARYVEHLRTDTFPKLREIGGFRGASILRRSVPKGTEFLVVTLWNSLEAIRSFAGQNPETAVVPPSVQAMMTDYDRQAVHYDVVE
jgi:heme-degrading monooxygenase HmoA